MIFTFLSNVTCLGANELFESHVPTSHIFAGITQSSTYIHLYKSVELNGEEEEIAMEVEGTEQDNDEVLYDKLELSLDEKKKKRRLVFASNEGS